MKIENLKIYPAVKGEVVIGRINLNEADALFAILDVQTRFRRLRPEYIGYDGIKREWHIGILVDIDLYKCGGANTLIESAIKEYMREYRTGFRIDKCPDPPYTRNIRIIGDPNDEQQITYYIKWETDNTEV